MLKKPLKEQLRTIENRPISPPFFPDKDENVIKVPKKSESKISENRKVNVIYDNKLNCFYDPESNQYYEAQN